MSRERSGRVGSPMVVMSCRDLGLSQAGTYLKKPWAHGHRQGILNKDRKHYDKVRVFSEPAFRLPMSMAAFTPGLAARRGMRPLPWLEAAIESGLVEMASRKGGSPKASFVEAMPGKELPYCSRADLERQLAEAIAADIKQYEESQKK